MAEKATSRGPGRRFWSLPRKRRGAPGRHKPGESEGMAPLWGLRTSVPSRQALSCGDSTFQNIMSSVYRALKNTSGGLLVILA